MLDVGKEFPYIRVKLHIRLRKTEIQHKSYKYRGHW
jgi:hypothetical protein